MSRSTPRSLVVALSVAVAFVGLNAAPAHAVETADAVVTRNMNAAQPLTSVRVRIQSTSGPFAADYSLTWNLEKFDKPVTGRSGTLSGTLSPDSSSSGRTAVIDVSSAGLPDGTYEVAGTIEVTPTSPSGLEPSSLPFSVDVVFDRVGPNLTLTGDRSIIYPKAPPGYTSYSPFVQVGIKGPDTCCSGYSVVVRRPGGPSLRVLQLGDTYWNGKLGGAIAPPGAYEVVALDDRGNPSPSKLDVTVNDATFVKRTWKRVLRADTSIIRRTVGRCSTLRTPSLRGWAGSLGMYANARCGDRSNAASLITTRHAVRIPAGALYEYLSVGSFGGAATARPNSYALAAFIKKDGSVAQRHIAYDSNLGIHGLMTINDPRIRSALLRDRTFRWQVEVGHDYRYDVKNFTVTVSYYTIA